ncbi:hypothetical protein BY458DRAFT_590246 [Sporodiniella umbellata]|nr:hypothetical protein BY458DRAFT_590246 [Sporodiniella umbellata]
MARIRRIYFIPLLALCLNCLVNGALSDQEVITSIEKTDQSSTAEINGEQLYTTALEYLEEVEKRHNQTNLLPKANGIWQEIFSVFQTTTEIVTHKEVNTEEYKKATLLLEEAVNAFQNKDALLLLAEMNLFSKYAHPRNYQQAFAYYNELASQGNATAQYMLGFMYATGIGIEKDHAKASIYYTFAAHGGNTMAEMTLGYRHLYGIHTEESCEDALYYYRNVAEKSIRHYRSGPPNGHIWPLSKVRLSDEEGGIYGLGSSMTVDKDRYQKSSINPKELLQFWKYLGESEGDIEALLELGKVYYLGTRAIKKDFKEAIKYFTQIVDKRGFVPKDKARKKEYRQIGEALGYLGLMSWRGEGVKPNPKIAYEWFIEGLDYDDPVSQNSIGWMYKYGIVVEENRRLAIKYFEQAAIRKLPDAEINLALEYVQDEKALQNAIELLNRAAKSKHMLAYWYLAQLNDQGYIPSRSCRVSVHYYKVISEEGDWFNPTVENGYHAYITGDRENALLYYMLSAERGYEIAQSNVAFLLDPDRKLWDFVSLLTKKTKKKDENAENNAFTYWSRSAHQNNVDARVKMCDYYYKGIGTKVDYEKAAACYRSAAEDYQSPLAYWNLGWMYENGIGVAKDLPLAKRAYDLALEKEPDAYLPIKLSLLSWWKKWWKLSLVGAPENSN